MSTVRAIIRFSFTENKDDGQKFTAVVTAFIQGATEKSALSYLTRKYPNRYNLKIIDLIIPNE